jgi:hypothetical protein
MTGGDDCREEDAFSHTFEGLEWLICFGCFAQGARGKIGTFIGERQSLVSWPEIEDRP